MIFYFTGTGNSLAAARQISQILNEPLVPISGPPDQQVNNIILKDDEIAGLVFPVYFYTLPRLVSSFIRGLRFTAAEQPYLFAVMTCGGQTGAAGQILEELLFRQRLPLSYQAAVVLPDNYVPLLHVPDETKQKKLILTAEQELAALTAQIAARKTGDYNTKKGFAPGVMTRCAAPFYRDGCKTGKFYANENCTHCGHCAGICPEQVIGMQDRIPVWHQARCTFCLACLHRCPAQAIQYGRMTRGKARYVHPHMQQFLQDHPLLESGRGAAT